MLVRLVDLLLGVKGSGFGANDLVHVGQGGDDDADSDYPEREGNGLEVADMGTHGLIGIAG